MGHRSIDLLPHTTDTVTPDRLRRPTSRDGDAARHDRRELGRGQRLDHAAQRGEQPFHVRGVVQDEARGGVALGVVEAAPEGEGEGGGPVKGSEHSRGGGAEARQKPGGCAASPWCSGGGGGGWGFGWVSGEVGLQWVWIEKTE